MEYILSASQISDKECGDMGPISKYSLSDMGPTVDYRIFPGIFSSWNQNKLFQVENTPRQSYRQYCILTSRRAFLAIIALEI